MSWGELGLLLLARLLSRLGVWALLSLGWQGWQMPGPIS